MVRLKYNQIADDNLIYTDWFTVGPNFVVRAIINTETYTYQVFEFNSEVVVTGECKDLRSAKDAVKKQLTQIGVVFEGEIRTKQ